MSSSNANSYLAALVKGARDRATLTQKDLASAMGYSREWIQKIEAGTNIPGVKVLAALADALQLSPWETRYLHLLGGRTVLEAGTPPKDIDAYLESLMPHPAAWVTPGWTVVGSNRKFLNLFPGVWMANNFIHWHYHSVRSRKVIANWEQSSEWCVGWLRYNLAANPDHPAITRIIDSLMPITVFREQWDQPIPTDPETRPWIINNEGAEMTFDMRTWHSPQASGSLLLGVVLN
ncbi:helix-turn-helix domain-containing protein [Mycobacteroides abscessus]|uniref:helix-turn-helix domain-containing protein n=1 Tax=Mycobacteroides abscessus TaxID=36809 RepID=UPI0013FD0D0C|nr:helix-turn-helix domain-containing protein [Mycobacteroides abscessus]